MSPFSSPQTSEVKAAYDRDPLVNQAIALSKTKRESARLAEGRLRALVNHNQASNTTRQSLRSTIKQKPKGSAKPTAILVEGKKEWRVEKVLQHRYNARRLHYLVKWMGFPMKEATWEPYTNLGNAQALVQEYANAHLRGQLPPASEPRNTSEREWQVETVLEHRYRNHRLQYLVKWLGFPMEEATWEPHANLNNAQKLVQEYVDTHLDGVVPRKTDKSSNDQDVEIDEDNEWQVEKILKHRYRNHQLQYLVKWLEYPEDEATWEPSANLSNAQAIVQEYADKHLEGYIPSDSDKSSASTQPQEGSETMESEGSGTSPP